MTVTHHCAYLGHIGGVDLWLPETLWDRDLGGLHPRVGCTQLRCEDCGQTVRSMLGQRLATGFSKGFSGLSPDLPLGDALPLTADAYARTYACQCRSFAAVATQPLQGEGDDWHDPALPWRCAGHPPLVLPMTVDGVHLETAGDWDSLVAEALAGITPRNWSVPGGLHGRHPAVWLARIVGHLDDVALADAIAARVAPHLLSSAANIRRGAVNFYRHLPGAPGAASLGAAMTSHRGLYEGVTLPEMGPRDLADELRECVGVQLAHAPSPSLVDAVKAELLAGRGTTLFVLWMGQHESDWLTDHAAQLVRLQVASRGRLQRAVAAAPQSTQDRMAAILAVP